MTPEHSWKWYLARLFLGLTVFIVPIMGYGVAMPMAFIATSAIVASDGLRGRIVIGCILLLMSIELIWGVDLGVLSLSFLVAVIVFRLAQKFFALTPLSHESGWSPVALIKAVLIASILALIMVGVSVCIEAFIYGRGSVSILFTSAYYPFYSLLVTTGLGSLIILAGLHRIDVPFRRAIVFGT